MAKKIKKAPSKVTGKIPFQNTYDGGIFEDRGFYTEMYVLENLPSQDAEALRYKLNKIYERMPEDCTFQILVHNALITKEDYLKKVLVAQNTPQAKVYNEIVVDTTDIGHNNIRKFVYLVVGKRASSIDEARQYFESIEESIASAFEDIPLSKMDTVERLEVFYRIFNAKKNKFGSEADLNNDGNIQLENLKYMGMTEKDMIAPKKWDTNSKYLDYTILDKGLDTECYSRTLFVNCVPKDISINVISDLTSVSSNMLFSIFYNPMDAKLGFNEVSKRVKSNTSVVKKAKRETLQDKKNKTTVSIAERKENNEKAYFDEAALEVTKVAVAAEEPFMEVTIIVTLFADTLEELERNTDMLKVSSVKFACNIKPLDMLQFEGFCSSLPLCKQRVDVSRFFNAKKLAEFSPVSAATSVKSGGIFSGLNALNDNHVFVHRKNGTDFAGVILGAEKSGKTYQVKREVLGAMVTTSDNINIISTTDEYDEFVASLGGVVSHIADLNPFCMVNGYGLTEDAKKAKKHFLKALSNSEEEAEKLVQEPADFNNAEEMFSLVGNSSNYEGIATALGSISEDVLGKEEKSRLRLFKARTREDVLVFMEYLWNQSIKDKKQNITNWLFVDAIDEVLKHEDALSYLVRYVKGSRGLMNVTTFVIEEISVFVHEISTKISAEELIAESGYIKLLNCGPVERKELVNILNIPNALVPFITNVEHSKGLIITSVTNIPFDDNFLDKDSEFVKMHNI